MAEHIKTRSTIRRIIVLIVISILAACTQNPAAPTPVLTSLPATTNPPTFVVTPSSVPPGTALHIVKWKESGSVDPLI